MSEREMLTRAQAYGVRRVDMMVSLAGDYREDDARERWLVFPSGGFPITNAIRWFRGRTREEALERMMNALDASAPLAVEPDPFPPSHPYRKDGE